MSTRTYSADTLRAQEEAHEALDRFLRLVDRDVDRWTTEDGGNPDPDKSVSDSHHLTAWAVISEYQDFGAPGNPVNVTGQSAGTTWTHRSGLFWAAIR